MKRLLAIGCLSTLLLGSGCGVKEKGPVEAETVQRADPKMIQEMMRKSMEKMPQNVNTSKLPTEAPK